MKTITIDRVYGAGGHTIGKQVASRLGLEIYDRDIIRNAVKDSGAKVLGLSCLLASCSGSILDTVQAVEAAGLRDDVKIIIGGGPIDQHVVDYSGADTFGGAAQETVDYCEKVYA